MMVDLHRSFAEPLSEDKLCAWNRMLTSSQRGLLDPGQYRRHAEPMQIISGAARAPKAHFEAPPSSDMPKEMARFIDWFNRTSPAGASALPVLTRAGIAHSHFVCIHPFVNRNKRMGRVIIEKALAQSLGRPPLTALAATILDRRKPHHQTLERSDTKSDLTDWLTWFASAVLEARRRTMVRIEFMIDKTRMLDRLWWPVQRSARQGIGSRVA